MKKIIAMLLCAAMLVSLCGCDAISNLLEPGSDELVGTRWVLWSINSDGTVLEYNDIRMADEALSVEYSGEIEFTDTYTAELDLMGVTGECSYKLIDNQLTINDQGDVFETTVENDRFILDVSGFDYVEEDVIMEFALDDGTLMQQLSGKLADTEWVLYSAAQDGILLNYGFLQSFGYVGSIAFDDNAEFEMELELDYEINGEGYYNCWVDGSGASLYSEGEKMDVTIDNDVMLLGIDDGTATVELSFVQAGSELLEASAQATIDESYSGELDNTIWPLYYIEEDGVYIDREMLESVGTHGSITFGEGTYVLELDAENFEGSYVMEDNYVILQMDGYDVLALERENGVLMLDADGTVMGFGYDTELN